MIAKDLCTESHDLLVIFHPEFLSSFCSAPDWPAAPLSPQQDDSSTAASGGSEYVNLDPAQLAKISPFVLAARERAAAKAREKPKPPLPSFLAVVRSNASRLPGRSPSGTPPPESSPSSSSSAGNSESGGVRCSKEDTPPSPGTAAGFGDSDYLLMKPKVRADASPVKEEATDHEVGKDFEIPCSKALKTSTHN
jgi:hypothetical protein